MRGIGMKKSQQESGKSRFTKKGSKLRTASQIINGNQIPNTNKYKQRMKSHANTADSNVLNGTVTGGKGTTQDSINRKAVSRVMLPKTLGSKISKKQHLSRLQNGKSSRLSSKENEDNANEDLKIQKLKTRKKRKRQKNKAELDEAPRLQRRSRYLLIKMKLEQNLIDAYSGEGWKGQSREKIKPDKELQRAKRQILKCKLGIRDAIRQLESLGSIGCIEDSIICAKCKLSEAFPDNDIIPCDGTCNCAFHQKCLDPPLASTNIPPGDQGFLCRFCECKMEILEAMNAHLGTRFSVNSSWQDIFKEEATLPDGGVALSNMEANWPSDDSEDDDYDPEKNEYSCSTSKVDSDHSGSDDANTSGSLSWSFEREAFSGSEMSEKRTMVSKSNGIYLTDSEDSDDNNDHKIINGRRQRRAVDYKKLYDEMFGKDAPGNEQLTEDEDWGPAKRKRRGKESDAVSILMTLCESEKKNSDAETMEVKWKQPPDTAMKRPIFRIPPNAVQKLRQVFAENELPSRSVKESLSKQLCLDPEKVNKWFKNARYTALKTRKVKRDKEFQSSTPRISEKSRLEIMNYRTTDLTVSRDTSSETLVRTTKNMKKVHRRKSTKSLLGSPSKSNKVIMELSDDLSLKNQLQLLKSKCKREKKQANFKPGGGAQAAEMQMERLCRIAGQIETMRRALSRFQKKCDSDVIYVPVAELREKL